MQADKDGLEIHQGLFVSQVMADPQLPAGEQGEIEALARAKLSAGGPVPDYMAQTLIRVEQLRLTIERHPGHVVDFDPWSASRAA
jgi:hypothetical protein